jgi:hypothetical protein
MLATTPTASGAIAVITVSETGKVVSLWIGPSSRIDDRSLRNWRMYWTC